MAASTGPILAIGAITMTNDVIVHGRDIDWRVPIAAGGAVVVFAMLEKPVGPAIGLLAWASLIVSLFVPHRGDADPPITAIAKYFDR